MAIDQQYLKRLGVEQDHPTLGFWVIDLLAGTDIDTVFELMELKPGMKLVEAYIDIETAAGGAGTLTLDLETDEGTPYEWFSAVDAESAAKTLLATGKVRTETGTNKLVLNANYTGVITAGVAQVMCLFVRQEH